MPPGLEKNGPREKDSRIILLESAGCIDEWDFGPGQLS